MGPRCPPLSSSKSLTMRKRKEEMPPAFCHWKLLALRAEFSTLARIFCSFIPWERDRLTFFAVFPQIQWFSILAAWLTTWGSWKTIRARGPPQTTEPESLRMNPWHRYVLQDPRLFWCAAEVQNQQVESCRLHQCAILSSLIQMETRQEEFEKN